MVTIDDVKENKTVVELIDKADEVLGIIGYEYYKKDEHCQNILAMAVQ